MAEQLISIAIAAALSYAASQLTKEKKPQFDDSPGTTSERGSWIPRVLGIARTGPVIGKVWNRVLTQERSGAAPLFGRRPKRDLYLEDGWHILAVGPVKALYEIEVDGTVIWNTVITPSLFPSGTTIAIPWAGFMTIYWGEITQPVNTDLADANAVGIESRWPGICYIQWESFRLGTSPRWPNITYVIETEPQETHLTETDHYFPSTGTPIPFDLKTGEGGGVNSDSVPSDWTPPEIDYSFSFGQLLRVDNGAEDVGRFFVLNDSFVRITQFCRVSDASAAPPAITVDPNAFRIKSFAYEEHFNTSRGRTQTYIVIYPEGGVANAHSSGVWDSGNVRNLEFGNQVTGTGSGAGAESDKLIGLNPAHAMAEIIFSKWPYGMSMPKARFDLDSFEFLGKLMWNEIARGAFLMRDGKSAGQMLADTMQDFGTLMPIDFSTGKLEVVPVREPGATPPNLEDDVILRPPETEIFRGRRQVDRIVFQFLDQDNRFRTMTIGIDDDGQAQFLEYFQADEVAIESTVNFQTAAFIAERRSLELLASPSSITLLSTRDALRLKPGWSVTAFGFDQRLRIMSVKPVPNSPDVKIALSNDFYGVPNSGFETTKGDPGPVGTVEPPPEDLAVAIFEVPEALIIGEPQTIIMLRIRAQTQVVYSDIYLSADGVTYDEDAIEDRSIIPGGLLQDGLAADGLFSVDEGPTMELSGPDSAEILDLTGNDAAWLSGRQLAIINGEVMFLKKITSLGDSLYRLDGLIRARYDTRRVASAQGDFVYILKNDEGTMIQGTPLAPSTTVYAKSQPISLAGSGADLADITAVSAALYGKNVRPVPVSNVALDLASHSDRLSYADDAQTLNLRWSYSTPRSQQTGAGMFPAGQAQDAVPPEGTFKIEILTTGDVLRRTATSSTASYPYTEAERTADSLSGASFKVRVTQQRAGFEADPTTVTITKT